MRTLEARSEAACSTACLTWSPGTSTVTFTRLSASSSTCVCIRSLDQTRSSHRRAVVGGSLVRGVAHVPESWETSTCRTASRHCGQMNLTLSDPSYTDRLISFFASLGRTLHSPEPGHLVLDEELADLELAMYLRVWHVLHPAAIVTVGQ